MIKAVELAEDVVEQIELYQESSGTEIEDNIPHIVNDAIRKYVRELERQALIREQEAFRRQHPQLVGEYLGQYVAFHQERLIDWDKDERSLMIRVRQRYPNKVIGIFPVDETSEMRTFRHLSVRLAPPSSSTGR
ncbi:MAG: hypothetical protein KF893_11530 [Caldilineaceae bacterium]|nr:hypothetical protein [Caldilineaceae bacterium]